MSPTFEELVAEGASVPVEGWDFSWFEGRATEERPPWGYSRLIGQRMASATAALDIQTGGGEVLAQIPQPPPRLVATESWPPNVEIARRNLAPLGGTVVAVDDDADLPFPADSFDLVVSRHPVQTRWDEVARVLAPGGTFLSQMVGAGSVRELTDAMMGPRVSSQARSPRRAARQAEAAGLVAYLFRQPLWLLGWIAAVGGFAFQALALHRGQLSVVQPLLITELVFVLVLRRAWIRQDVARAAWVAAGVVCVSLGVFLAVAEPTGGHPHANTAEWLSALLAFGGAVALLALLGVRGSPVHRAACFAVAGGLAWALMAVFIKATTDTLAMFGVGGMLARWPVYALAVSAVAGTVLEQAAIHVGPLSVSQPLLVVINPLASIALSVWLFDERFTASPARVTIAVVSFAVMAAGVVMLSRTAPRDVTPSEPVPDEHARGRTGADRPRPG